MDQRKVVTEPDQHARRVRAAVLKERIYLTFTALAVVLTFEGHPPARPVQALATLAVTILGVLLAVFLADIVADVIVHERVPSKQEVRHALKTSFGAIAALVWPFAFFGLALVGILSLEFAIRASAVTLVVALIVIGFVAIRRVPLTWWQRLVALGAEALLGLAALGLQILAHG